MCGSITPHKVFVSATQNKGVTMLYTVEQYRITRESDFQASGDCWVARDNSGNWRCFCKAEFATNADDAARAMFHADEIDFVTGDVCGIKVQA